MKLILRLIIIGFLFSSCNTQKTISKDSNTISKTTMEDYKTKGYTLGTLIESKTTGDCRWVIRVQGSSLQYDPINIEAEKFAYLTQKKGDIVFKFLPLRQMNRCPDISPIQLTEVIENP